MDKPPSLLKTIGDLRRALEERGLSPESLAKQTKISNMTIRRLLKRQETSLIPGKYHLILNFVLGDHGAQNKLISEIPLDFPKMLVDLEADGKKCESVEALKPQIDEKLSDAKISSFFTSISRLYKHAQDKTLSAKSRMVAVGAILYFINPFDLIPDATPFVGYLDDLAVVTLALSFIAKELASPTEGKVQA